MPDPRLSPNVLAVGSLLAALVLPGPVWAESPAAGSPRYEIAWATYLGGSRDEQLREIIVYPDGSLLLGGQTNSNDLPTTPGAVQQVYGGEEPPSGHPGVVGGDCFLAHLSADGSKILAATYLGGSKQERNVYGMALDASGNVVITSATRSPDLPTRPGAFQRQYGGPPSDWMAAKLSADLKQLIWATYLGGSGDDFPRGGLAVDAEDNVYIVGETVSKDFPTTPRAYQTRPRGDRDAAIVKLRPDGSGLTFSTLLGGSRWDGLMGIRVDAAGDLYVAGHTQSGDFPVTNGSAQGRLAGQSDCYLAKVSADGARLLYATYLGGAENEFAEHRPCLLADGSVLLTGVTASSSFPTTSGAYQKELRGETDGFLTKISPDGKQLVFSTFLGGSGGEFFLMPTPDAGGNIFLVGTSGSRDFPVTSDALQIGLRRKADAKDDDGLLAVLSPDGSQLIYAAYLGGTGDDLIRSIALGPDGAVYLVGSTSSPDFPATSLACQTAMRGKSDGFVVKLVPSADPDRQDAQGRPSRGAAGPSRDARVEKVEYQVELVDPVPPAMPPRTYDLVQLRDHRGFPLEYTLSFVTHVCTDNQCKPVEVTMTWDAAGYFQRLQYPPGKPLTKKEHAPFTPQDYAKLDRILKDRNAILRDWSPSYLEKPAESGDAGDAVDAVTAPTPATVQDSVIQDAAYTTWALWHWANGRIVPKLRSITEESCTPEYLNHLLVSEDRRLADFALDYVARRHPSDPRFVDGIFHVLENGDREQITWSLDLLSRAVPDKQKLHARLVDSLGRIRPADCPLVLEKLAADPDLPAATLEALTGRLTQLPFFPIHLILKMLEERKFASEKTNAGVAALLENDDFFIARRAYEYLDKQDLDADTEARINAFRERYRERL